MRCRLRLGPLTASLLLLAACHGHEQVEGGGASAASAPGAAADAPASPVVAASAPTAEPVVTEVTLSTGARLRLPPDTIEKANPKGAAQLPPEAKKARVFLLGRDAKRLLMVTEMDRQGKSCDAALDEQRDKIHEAQKDTDPMRTGVRKVASFEELKVGGQRLLYTETKQRKLVAPGAEPLPFVGIASAALCHDDAFVVLMYASDQAELPGGTKKMLVDVAASWRNAE